MAPTQPVRNKSFILLTALFFTALSSLVYQLVWVRKLSHLFGTSALAESTVLSVFMGGLALGSLYGGRLLARASHPYRFLAGLELAIGATCLAAVFAFSAAHASYLTLLDWTGGGAAFHVALFAIASAILIVPTFLIGAAFPTIVQLYHLERRAVGESVGSCYMVDTVGGALGVLLTAFVLVAAMGFLRVSVLASALNLLMGALVWWSLPQASPVMSRAAASPAASADAPAVRARGRDVVVLAVFFGTGFAALCFEVLWIRHVSLIYGGSLHSFAIVVVGFLLGLALGSGSYNLLLYRVRNQVRLFAAIAFGIGLSSILLTAAFPRLEELFLRLYDWTQSFSTFVLTFGLVCALLILVPTLMMGATLPVLARIYARQEEVGIDVGRLYAVNSFGSLVGSFAAGFLIIPALGIQDSALVAGGIYLLAGVVFLLTFEPQRATVIRTLGAFAGLSVIATGIYGQIHRPNHLYNGAFYLGTVYESYSDEYFRTQEYARRSLKFLAHDPHGQVAVYGQGQDSMVLTSNGKVDASSDPAGLVPRLMVAHLPLWLHENPRDVAAIGLGGGFTLAGILRHDVESADMLEINAAVVRANLEVLSPYNENSLAHPRSNVIVSDGRNFLSNTDKRYDVVISEPPEIWVSGVSSLFTAEFYATAARALREDGLLCQWIPRYDLTDADYQTLLLTIRQSFPYIYEFNMQKLTGLEAFAEYVVVGSKRPIQPRKRLRQRRRQFLAASEDARSAYMLDMLDRARRTISRGHEEIASEVRRAVRVNTDDHPLLEFHALRNRFRKHHLERS